MTAAQSLEAELTKLDGVLTPGVIANLRMRISNLCDEIAEEQVKKCAQVFEDYNGDISDYDMHAELLMTERAQWGKK